MPWDDIGPRPPGSVAPDRSPYEATVMAMAPAQLTEELLVRKLPATGKRDARRVRLIEALTAEGGA